MKKLLFSGLILLLSHAAITKFTAENISNKDNFYGKDTVAARAFLIKNVPLVKDWRLVKEQVSTFDSCFTYEKNEEWKEYCLYRSYWEPDFLSL
jgi:hypothetical protein